MNKSSTGLDENIAGVLCYVLGWITGIIFFLIESENKTVKFHAMQSILVFGAASIVMAVFGRIWIFNAVIGAVMFILWVVLMFKAYRGEKYRLPVAGDLAEKWVK
jgi:uncharacterized membrane protein